MMCCLVLCLVLTAASFNPPSSSAASTSASSSSLTSAGEESLIASCRVSYAKKRLFTFGVPLRGGGLTCQQVCGTSREGAYGGTGKGVSRASATRSKWIVSWESVGTLDMIELERKLQSHYSNNTTHFRISIRSCQSGTYSTNFLPDQMRTG
jgi:hypothetical protein